MEAATPLRQPRVSVLPDRLLVDDLVVDDETAVRLAGERERAGEDPVPLLLDAIEIGARVLDREQTGAHADFVKAEFEKVSREVESAFTARADEAGRQLGEKLEEVFGPDSGHLTKALEKHFSDDSQGAVQNRVTTLVGELMAKSREDLQRMFSSDEGHNPLAGFQKAALATIKQTADQQAESLRAMTEKVAALELQLQKLGAEEEKQLELAEEREKGTAKGRTYEEAVFEAVDAVAGAQGDDCDAVGDVKGATRKTGDILVGIDGCRGRARGRIVFEAKNAKLSKPEALRELDRGMGEREADYAVLVVPSEEKLPARTQAMREYNGDKLFVVFDPEQPGLALDLAYRLARARVLMARGAGEGIDAALLAESVERAQDALEDERKVKQQLTGATTSIENARKILEDMTDRVRDRLADIDRQLAGAADDAAE